MNNDHPMTANTYYGQEVYRQMHGLYEPGTIPGVCDESEDGFVGKYIHEIYEALSSLSSRYAFSIEDPDAHRIMTAIDTLLEESAVRMFHYGVKYAKQGKL